MEVTESYTEEYRVKPVIRYIVTRYTQVSNSDGKSSGASCETIAEVPNEHIAQEIASRMANLPVNAARPA